MGLEEGGVARYPRTQTAAPGFPLSRVTRSQRRCPTPAARFCHWHRILHAEVPHRRAGPVSVSSVAAFRLCGKSVGCVLRSAVRLPRLANV